MTTPYVVEWIKQTQTMNTAGLDREPSISADSTGLYVAYETLDTAPGQDNTNSGQYDIVVMRMNKDTGLVEWIKQTASMNTKPS